MFICPMGWKDFFIVDKKRFSLFVIFVILTEINFLKLRGLNGNSPFDIFSFFNQFDCLLLAKIVVNVPITAIIQITCISWNDFILPVFILVLNIFWQLFLANLVIFLYYKIREKK